MELIIATTAAAFVGVATAVLLVGYRFGEFQNRRAHRSNQRRIEKVRRPVRRLSDQRVRQRLRSDWSR